MGASMCGHLLSAGYRLTVHNRTRQKAEPLLARGARWADSPKTVAENSDVIFTMVGYPADVRAVILGPEGVLAGCREGCVIVDMTTSEPSLAAEIAAEASRRGVHAIDAPVSGGDVGAREARLSIMIGGQSDVVDALMPCFEVLGKTIVHHGPPGAGQHAKLVNQILIASNMVGVCEGLLYAYKAGLDLQAVLRSVSSGAAGSWSLANLGPRIIANDFAPGFFVEHFIKDMGIAGGGETDGPGHAGAGPGASTLPVAPGARRRAQRHSGAATGAGCAVEDRLAQPRRFTLRQQQIEGSR